MLHCAWELRKAPTPAEAKLWAFLRTLCAEGVHFRRQYAIRRYIAEFCAPRRKLVIEVDGSQHLEQIDYDAERTVYLKEKGCRVLRFFNNEVMNNLPGVMGAILEGLNQMEEEAKGSTGAR
ncbi:MAG: endonuclease domain-containing protein [Anaerolineales bacterium]|nr:endonuclease domain-containing protein [Anaerolineales bacterium]